MSAFIDFEDTSVDKAIEKACKELNISREKLKFDIISHGSSGIFGLVGAKKALIRVVNSGLDRNGKTDSKNGSMARGNHTCPDDVLRDLTPDASEVVSALVDEAFGKESRTGKPSELTDDEASLSEENENVASVTDAPTPEADRIVSTEDYDSAVVWIQGFLEKIISLTSPDSSLSVKIERNFIYVKIEGGDAARIIGKRGQTLDSIQYIAEKAINKQFGSNILVEIDVEDYLERKRAELVELAHRLAEKAIQTGKPMVINRINSNDRRVVHLALKENKGIRTQSAGNGDLRKLLILPKKKANSKKNTKKPDIQAT